MEQQQTPQTWWQRQMAVYRYDIAQWRGCLQRIGRPVQPVQVGGKPIALYIIAVVVGGFVMVSCVISVVQWFAR